MKFTFFKKAGKWSKWAVHLGKRAVHLTKSFICSLGYIFLFFEEAGSSLD